ncbi:polysaccharide pyruvyl transferase family protein [Zunongwangia sp. F363]|uniref:Polysaccharide pyruvyl transferase family protein n=1 Tax=Autumnicola tepida TaxID=3075595 RepID=A0ABU3C872_9FLAO|nr:polysaccharide pyruvyl transferase family protein [Zunongwangia sp. F363]MDT0642280.1 polysaccharide pyruvyl transferase family protein [Zunongwangia sp. F363]
MKIGILSLPMWNNYGGILQAYALQSVLKDLGHETEFINRHHPKPSFISEKKNKFKRFLKQNLISKENTVFYPDYRQKNYISTNTLEFIKREIKPITAVLVENDHMKSIGENYDAIIVGSDQVWRPRYVPDIYNYFLDFASEDVIKISFAASFGTDKWEYSPEETKVCRRLLQNFNRVSVREDSAVALVKEKFNVKAEHTLDPTMLLDKSRYLDLVRKYEKERPSKGDLFTYILDSNLDNDTIVGKVSSRLNLKPFEVMPKPFDKDFNHEVQEYIFPQLTKWLKAFNDAEFVIADSFHGCVFSIIFNKPFIAIGNKERGLARFKSLLKMFQLEDRLILSPAELNEDLIDSKINWTTVNGILENKKKVSFSFLQEALTEKEK